MEPREFDKIIKEKLGDNQDLPTTEIDLAKPFIWMAIQNRTRRTKLLSRYHFAAVITFLIILFASITYHIQKERQAEINLLKNRISQLEKKYTSQSDLLQRKDSQIESLRTELQDVGGKLTKWESRKSVSTDEQIVYRTDTVIVREVKYISSGKETQELNDQDNIKSETPLKKFNPEDQKEEKTDHIIFFSRSERNNHPPSETMKIKFGSFTKKD
jgi:septal ring factor EnvC (AmiA/AmiB activator)